LFCLLLCGIGLASGPKADEARPSSTKGDSQANQPPREWIDPSTGHRVIRLSTEPGSSSFYFHQNGYAESGDKMVFSTREGLATVDLKTGKIEPLVSGRVHHMVVGKKSRQAFYMKDDTVYATHLDTRATRTIVKRSELRSGSGLTVNADETVLAGSYTEGGPATMPPPAAAPRGTPAVIESRLEARWAARRPMVLYTIRIKTGEVETFHHSTDWLNHVQFSPSDPTLLMFCHEGPWHKVDRIWTIRTDGSGLRKMHTRTMDMEIAGHEFWSPDGQIIWYDLQTPRGQEFWLAGLVLATGEKIRYKVERDQWSVHFNVSRDGKLFAGDGGGPQMVAKAKDGQWIYLFRPENGVLRGERLVNMARHDYQLEPNVTFTPDWKWIVFRSNMHGASHVYAVEVNKN
jgi:oligogalacturonide lyase